MIQEISKTKQHNAEDGVKAMAQNSPETIKAIFELNKELEEFRREYRIKDKKSQVSAAGVILTA